MTSTTMFQTFSVICTLGEQSIYLKLVDSNTFMCYESNLEHAEFRLSVDLHAIYQLLVNSFRKDEGYAVVVSIMNHSMKLQFASTISPFIVLRFAIILREKLIANDSQISIQFSKIEKEYKDEILSLREEMKTMKTHYEERIEKLEEKIRPKFSSKC